jgi:type VI secretion system protein ImpB
MAKGQKFIGANRAPRVQIEYDVELFGAQKKVQLPFVMGVLADLSGQPDPDRPEKPLAQREFQEFDVDNFDQRMKAIRPRAQFRVKDTLSGEEGKELPVTLSFERMEDFAPDAVARRIEPLRKLLEAREQLQNLVTYMDGKVGAEALVEKLLNDPDLLKTLAAQPKPAEG